MCSVHECHTVLSSMVRAPVMVLQDIFVCVMMSWLFLALWNALLVTTN